MNVESVTIVIVADGRALVIQPTPAQISSFEFNCANGFGEVPSEDSWVRRELDGTGTFTLRIEGERAAVNGTWVDTTDAPVVLTRREFDMLVRRADGVR